MMFFSLLISSNLIAAESHTINAEARRFVADILYVQPGDTVGWVNMTSHNTVSIDGLIPEGAEPWRSDMGQNLQLTLEIEGVYAYVCEPHLGFGMVGLIIVGEPTNLEAVREAALKLEGPYRRILGKLKKVQAPQ
jgi:pseudoazurin